MKSYERNIITLVNSTKQHYDKCIEKFRCNSSVSRLINYINVLNPEWQLFQD